MQSVLFFVAMGLQAYLEVLQMVPLLWLIDLIMNSAYLSMKFKVRASSFDCCVHIGSLIWQAKIETPFDDYSSYTVLYLAVQSYYAIGHMWFHLPDSISCFSAYITENLGVIWRRGYIVLID